MGLFDLILDIAEVTILPVAGVVIDVVESDEVQSVVEVVEEGVESIIEVIK